MSGKGAAPARTGATETATGRSASGASVDGGGDMGNQPGTDLVRLMEAYPENKFNQLLPAMYEFEGNVVSPVTADVVSVVRISPKTDDGDIYHDVRYAPAKQYGDRPAKGALTGQGLAKIAGAAGIEFDPAATRILDRRTDASSRHLYVAFQAVGRVRQPNGEWRYETATGDVDTEVAEEEFCRGYLEKIKKGWNKDQRGKPRYTEDDVPDMVERDVLALKKFATRRAETAAKNRVIRRLLSIKQAYTSDELARPFAVPRIMFRPEAAMALEQGRRAVEDLYGREVISLPSASARGRDEGSDEPSGGATGPEAAVDTASQAEATPAAPEPEPPKEPKRDPKISDGPHAGKTFSEVTENHPDYILALATEGRNKDIRDLAQSWYDYFYPTLGV